MAMGCFPLEGQTWLFRRALGPRRALFIETMNSQVPGSNPCLDDINLGKLLGVPRLLTASTTGQRGMIFFSKLPCFGVTWTVRWLF